jgi:hypothetical protein
MVSGVNSYQISAFRPNADEIEDWVERLDNVIVATHGIDCDAARKLAILETVIGDVVYHDLTNEFVKNLLMVNRFANQFVDQLGLDEPIS